MLQSSFFLLQLQRNDGKHAHKMENYNGKNQYLVVVDTLENGCRIFEKNNTSKHIIIV